MTVVTVSPSSAPLQATAEEAASCLPRRFLVALDASDHANRALVEAIKLSAGAGGDIAGIHAYAARLHEARFRQMEGGLPERYLEEDEMRHQRNVHDSLITRGLAMISDSYHDWAEAQCQSAGIPFSRLSPEGKNYRKIVEAAESGEFDVLALGALGLGVVPGSLIGTVCERVVRRCPIDVLVIKDPELAIGDGPIVVGIDGSAKSYGALKTAFEIARRSRAEVHAVAAYDPTYHSVAFNRIAGVLSEEAGKVFRFREQERLHEELIDDGIAKIYQAHLDVARKLADEAGVELTCKLLQGKAFAAVEVYLETVGASLVLVGKTGVHADAGLDIGGNAENLLRRARCHVWLSQASHVPPIDVVAEETISWSREAEAFLGRAPDFARGMARKAVVSYAIENGHTFITRDIVEEVAKRMMPKSRSGADEKIGSGTSGACPFAAKSRAKHGGAETHTAVEPAISWTAEAEARITKVPDGFMRGMTRARIDAFAAANGLTTVTGELVTQKYASWAEGSAKQHRSMAWDDDAATRVARIPEFVRGMVEMEIERCAREMGLERVTVAALEHASERWKEVGAFHSDTHHDVYGPRG